VKNVLGDFILRILIISALISIVLNLIFE